MQIIELLSCPGLRCDLVYNLILVIPSVCLMGLLFPVTLAGIYLHSRWNVHCDEEITVDYK